MKSLTVGKTGLIKPVVLWDKNRDVIQTKVNDGPYWNQSYWNVSMTVVSVHEGCWCFHSRLCVWMRVNRCQLWSVCYYLSCLFPWLWWRDLGFGPSGVTTLSGILVLFFFFWFVCFFFSFSGSSVSVNVKKTNKELCKLTFLFPCCFAVWEILENLEEKKPKTTEHASRCAPGGWRAPPGGHSLTLKYENGLCHLIQYVMILSNYKTRPNRWSSDKHEHLI